MRFVFAFFILVLLGSNTYGQHKFTLTGKVPQGLNDHKIYLRVYDYYSKIKSTKIDSTIVHDDSFVFNGTIEKPCELANIYISSKKFVYESNLNLVLETGVNQLITEDIYSNDRYPNNKLSHSIIINSRANFIKRRLDSIWYNISTGQKAVLSGGDKERKIFKAQLEVLAQYTDEYYSLVQLYEIARMASMTNELEFPLKTFSSFTAALKNSALGKEFLTVTTASINAYYVAKAGRQVPEFSIKTDKGLVFNNSSLKGSPYVIAFSATWCIPCQEYQKKLLAFYNKYQSQGLKIIYFNLDDNVIKWKKHIKEKKLNWINVSERTKFSDSKIVKQFNVNAIPLYIVVGRQGKIVYNADEMKDDNYEFLEEYIKKVL